MLRARRYRVFLVFAVFCTFVFFHLFGIAGWLSSAPEIRSVHNQNQNPFPGPAIGYPEDSENDLSHPHGFAPEPSFAVPVDPLIPPIVEDLFEDELSADLPVDAPSPSQALAPSPPQNPVTPDDLLQGGKGRVEGPDLDRGSIRWEKQAEHFPVPSSEIIPLPAGSPKPIPRIQFNFPEETVEERQDREKNLEIIKEAFLHAWNGYKENAMGRDEVAPVSGTPRDPFMGWGATLVDSLDTLWIMDFKEEFEEAVEETKKLDFRTSKRKDIPLFETVIRYLGGLIGAYDISDGKYPALLDKAVELAEILIGAFDTPNRMPATFYNWAPAYASQPRRAGSRVVLAELGSLSVEFTRLSQLTKKDKYYDAIARITNELEAWQNNTQLPGLWPSHIDASGCKKLPSIQKPAPRDVTVPSRVSNNVIDKRDTPVDDPLLEGAQLADYDNEQKPKDDSTEITGSDTKAQAGDRSENGPGVLTDYDCEKAGLQSAAQKMNPDRFTLGALADSTYEYLPKEYLLLGGQLDQYRTMYEYAMDTTRKHLLFRPMLPDNRDVRFLASATPVEASVNGKSFEYKYEGSHLHCFAGGMFGIGAKVFGLEGDLDIAKKLTDGCVWAYESTNSGIMPEHFTLLPCDSMTSCEWNQTAYYDAIDPFEDIRISRLKAWEELNEKLGKPVPNPEKSNAPMSPESQVKQAKEDDLDLNKRDAPTKTVRGDMRNPLGPKPIVLSHAEFAEQRIKEDRIPPGMVEVSSPKYLLRPEAIESVFIMYRITGDDSWRRKGWKMFESIAKNTRTQIAHSAIKDVTSEVPYFTDVMESFWLGETLKYFYLLFSDPQVVSLDEYIVNTEAHPHKRPSSL